MFAILFLISVLSSRGIFRLVCILIFQISIRGHVRCLDIIYSPTMSVTEVQMVFNVLSVH